MGKGAVIDLVAEGAVKKPYVAPKVLADPADADMAENFRELVERDWTVECKYVSSSVGLVKLYLMRSLYTGLHLCLKRLVVVSSPPARKSKVAPVTVA